MWVFHVDYFYRMQNDMKLPVEQRRKWVRLDLKTVFTLQRVIMWLNHFCVSRSYKHALDGLFRVWREGKAHFCISYSHEHLHMFECLSLNMFFSQREPGSCSQEPLWRPAEELWSLSDRWGSSAWWEYIKYLIILETFNTYWRIEIYPKNKCIKSIKNLSWANYQFMMM